MWTQSRQILEVEIEATKALDHKSWQPDLATDEARLQQRLEKLKLDMQVVQGDGNCQVWQLQLVQSPLSAVWNEHMLQLYTLTVQVIVLLGLAGSDLAPAAAVSLCITSLVGHSGVPSASPAAGSQLHEVQICLKTLVCSIRLSTVKSRLERA